MYTAIFGHISKHKHNEKTQSSAQPDKNRNHSVAEFTGSPA